MKMKTAELTGSALDWAVAKCEGYTLNVAFKKSAWIYYSTDWAQAGPIIERKRISVGWETFDTGDILNGCWVATVYTPPQGCEQAEGPTPLIAAMRCYVALKLGEEVEVPDELL